MAPLISMELRATETSSRPSRALAAKVRSSEYLPLVAALPICAAILAGMTVGSGAMTAGGVLAAFAAGVLWPPAGLAVLALMAPLKSPTIIPAPGFNTVLVGAILLGCVYRLPIDRPSLRPSLPLLLMLGFVLYVAMQQAPELANGYAGPISRQIGYLFIQLATLAGVAVAAAYVLRDRTPKPFIGAGILGALIAASLAIAVLTLPAPWLSNLVDFADATARVVGPFGDPNYFGLFQATAIAACLAAIVVTRSGRKRLLLAAVAIVLAIAFSIALSRGALVALAAGVLALAFTRGRRAGLLAAASLVILALVVYPLFLEWRLTADAGRLSAQAYTVLARSDQSRFAAALAGPMMFATAPLFEIGFGHYALISGRYTGYAIESHNWYANVLAEQGLVGVALWIPMLAAVAIQLYRAPRAARSVGLAVFVVYATGSAFLQPPLSVQTSAFAVIVIVAALVGDWSRFAATEQRPIDGAAEHAAARPSR